MTGVRGVFEGSYAGLYEGCCVMRDFMRGVMRDFMRGVMRDSTWGVKVGPAWASMGVKVGPAWASLGVFGHYEARTSIRGV
jgi:hypothetical protein